MNRKTESGQIKQLNVSLRKLGSARARFSRSVSEELHSIIPTAHTMEVDAAQKMQEICDIAWGVFAAVIHDPRNSLLLVDAVRRLGNVNVYKVHKHTRFDISYDILPVKEAFRDAIGKA